MFRRLSVLLAFLLAASPNFAQMSALTAESEVHSALAQFIHAFDNLDWDAFRTSFADDATVFYPRAFPERANGRTEFEKTFKIVFEQIRSGQTSPPHMHIEPRNLAIQIFGDTAVAT